MTKIINKLQQWQPFRQRLSSEKTIGFVPTMGNLHAGHESLLARAKAENDLTVLSIYVNPTQFNETADFEHYPRTQLEDIQRAEKLDVDVVLIPEKYDLYPDDYNYRISEQCLSKQLEGEHRPGHFDGMLTVVMKLLCLVKPTRSYFGEKDYQQLQLIRGLTAAFFLDTEIIGCATRRDENGLALSSRNARLTSDQYHQALEFAKLLQSDMECAEVAAELTQQGFKVDYITEKAGRRFGAVHIGNVRLIDNVIC